MNWFFGNPVLRKCGAFGVFLLLWQLVALSGWVPTAYFPTIGQIARASSNLFHSGELWQAERQTVLRAGAGLLLTVALGIFLALLATQWRLLARMWSPVVEIMRSIPPAALVPLAIFAIGLSPMLFIGIVVFAGFSTVYLTALHALGRTEPVQVASARAFGYGTLETLWRVRLPAAVPAIFTGIRVAAGAALIASIASEMLAGRDGLGYLLFDTAFSLRTAEMYAVLGVAGLNGILFNQLVLWVRAPFARWQDQLHHQGIMQ